MAPGIVRRLTTLRRAVRGDVDEIRRLIDASVRALSEDFYSPAQIEASLSEVFGVDTQLIDDGTYLVAVEGDRDRPRIAGCGGWSRRQTLYGGDQRKAAAGDGLLDPARDAARIRAFYVHPECARRGIGSSILRACKTAAAGAGFGRLELVATLPGVPLYEAMGYNRIAPADIEMAGGLMLPAIRMGKAL